MEYRDFASDLPPRHSVFYSLEECEEALETAGVHRSTRQLGKGAFRSDMASDRVDGVALYSDRNNRALSMYLEPRAGRVGLLVCRSAGEKLLADGEDVANDRLLVIPDGHGSDIVTPDLGGSDGITLPRERFVDISKALCPSLSVPEDTCIVDGDTAGLHALRRTIVNLVAQPAGGSHAEATSHLVEGLIAWMGNSVSGFRPEGPDPRQRQGVAKLARDYLEANFRETVRMQDLCNATGVSVRTLQRYFRNYFGVTITEFLKAVRLDAAHRMLVMANPAEESVTSIALRHGFTHLGRFSLDFRNLFGESPSQILAVQSGHR